MPTRFNSNSFSRFGVPGIADKTHQGSPDFSIPSVGIEDVDIALFNLFEKEISLKISGDNSQPKKVPVIFAAGEKWAMLKKRKALRDSNNSLILPLLTIVRNSITQDSTSDIAGRGINQQTGELIIRRRLDQSDRNYQNLINRYLLRNQKNVSSNDLLNSTDEQILTDRKIGEESDSRLVVDGALLANVKTKNVYETIVVPTPQFCTLDYEITLWTQFTQHMNQLIEQIMTSFLPQGNCWKLDTPKGYWFIATVANNSYEPENNVDDMSQEERIIKCKFAVSVKAYVFANSSPGINIPVKRYVSAPNIEFNVGVAPVSQPQDSTDIVDDPFLGSDDPTLPLSDTKSRRRDQRATGTRLYDPRDPQFSSDPALISRSSKQYRPLYKKIATLNAAGQDDVTYARVYRVTNSSGETVIKPATNIDSKPSSTVADTILGGLTYETSDR